MMFRSASRIAAVEAAPSAPGVSMIASVIPFFSSALSSAGSLPAVAATTAMSSTSRVFAQLSREACGSRSMTQTRSPISFAATASEDANVLFPDPPFWVTKAIVRMNSALFHFAPGRESRLGSMVKITLRVCGRYG